MCPVRSIAVSDGFKTPLPDGNQGMRAYGTEAGQAAAAAIHEPAHDLNDVASAGYRKFEAPFTILKFDMPPGENRPHVPAPAAVPEIPSAQPPTGKRG